MRPWLKSSRPSHSLLYIRLIRAQARLFKFLFSRHLLPTLVQVLHVLSVSCFIHSVVGIAGVSERGIVGVSETGVVGGQ